MTNIEQTGRNVEEATQLALTELGVSEDQVDVEILDEGSKGFFGLGQAPAKVRVTVKVSAESKRAEAAPRRERSRSRPRPKREAKPVQENKDTEPTPTPKQETKREPRKTTKREPKPAARQAAVKEPPKEQPVRETAPVVLTEDELRVAAETSCGVLQHILDGIGVGGKASIKSTGDSQVRLEIEDGDAGVLIGRHGQTVQAIQYLTAIITNRQSGHRVRVAVDIQGYRDRREQVLTQHAKALAEQVKSSGEEAVLEPLPATERRIIHAALADDEDVMTYSEGEEPERYVVISPKK
jgi:spoIIIJ-associated protein